MCIRLSCFIGRCAGGGMKWYVTYAQSRRRLHHHSAALFTAAYSDQYCLDIPTPSDILSSPVSPVLPLQWAARGRTRQPEGDPQRGHVQPPALDLGYSRVKR